MDFEPTEEQALFKAMLERFIIERYDAEKRRGYRTEPGGYSAENMAMLADLGILALPIAAEAGGLGGSTADVAMMMEALGRGLVVEPALSRAVIVGGLLGLFASAPQKELWLDPIIVGQGSVALALFDRVGDPAVRIDNAGRLSGTKTFVLDASSGGGLLIPCLDEHDRPALVLIPGDRAGIETVRYAVVDGSQAAEITFDAVAVSLDERLDIAGPELERALLRSSIAVAAEMLGVMQRLFEDTLDYIKTRNQFGRQIGSFQVLQHRMARSFVTLEQARSLLLKAMLTPEDEEAAWRHAVQSCRRFLRDASLEVAHDAVQLHGGIGITDELAIGHGHKRLLVLRSLLRLDAFAQKPERIAA